MFDESVKFMVDQGISEIIILSSSWKEQTGGYQNEFTCVNCIGKCKGKYIEFQYTKYKKFSPRSGDPKQSIVGIKVISESDYTDRRQNKTRADDQEFMKSYYEYREIKEMKKNLDKQAEICPSCGVNLVIKTGKRGPFWGCPFFRHNDCKQSRALTETQREIFQDINDKKRDLFGYII